MNTLLDIVTGFFIGLSVGGAAVLFYTERKNRRYEQHVKQLEQEHQQLQGRYDELEKRYSVMQATKAAQKITAPITQPTLSWIGPDNDGAQNYERFGGFEQ